MYDLVRNPKDRFACITAQIIKQTFDINKHTVKIIKSVFSLKRKRILYFVKTMQVFDKYDYISLFDPKPIFIFCTFDNLSVY